MQILCHIFLVLQLNNEWCVLQSQSLLGLLSRYPFFNSSPLNKMATISQIIFPDVFSWMKSFVFSLKFYWSLFLRVQLTITQHCLDHGLVPNRQQAIIWTNADMIYWRIYVALGGDELSKFTAAHLKIGHCRFHSIFQFKYRILTSWRGTSIIGPESMSAGQHMTHWETV